MLSVADQLRVISFLKQFGCNSREALAYIEALKTGTVSVQELARKLNRNRITVYYTIQQLVKKGLLFETRKGKKRYISAEHPDILNRIMEQRHSELRSMEGNLEHIIKILNSIHVVKEERTIIKVYEDIPGFKKMMEESLHSKDEILILSASASMTKLLGEDYMEQYFARSAHHGIAKRIIYPRCNFTEKIFAKRDEYKIALKIFPRHRDSEAGIFIWDSAVSLESLKEGKRICTIIENKDLAYFFKQDIFDHLWEEAEAY